LLHCSKLHYCLCGTIIDLLLWPRPLCKGRVPPVPHTKPLQESNNSQGDCSRPVVTPVVGGTRGGHHACQNAGDALVIYVVDAGLRPLVVENAYDRSARHHVDFAWSSRLEEADVNILMMMKKPEPSYHPILLAPRRTSGSEFIVGCLNWSSPFIYSRKV
jgi:hypothetical protein